MKHKNPLASLELFIGLWGGLMILFLLAVVPAGLLGSGSVFGFGDPIVCVEAAYGAVVTQGDGGGVSGAHIGHLANDVHASPSQFDLCDLAPSTGQRVLATLVDLPEFLFALGFIVITWRLIRGARRRGLFMSDMAAALGRLGVFLFVGEFVVTLVQAVATQRLVSSMLTGSHDDYTFVYALADFSWAVIIAAFGLQAMSRVMALTVPMKAEIDATV